MAAVFRVKLNLRQNKLGPVAPKIEFGLCKRKCRLRAEKRRLVGDVVRAEIYFTANEDMLAKLEVQPASAAVFQA